MLNLKHDWKPSRSAWRTMTPDEIAARELNESEINLLEALRAREYAESIVQENQQRIARLKRYLAERAKTQETPA